MLENKDIHIQTIMSPCESYSCEHMGHIF